MVPFSDLFNTIKLDGFGLKNNNKGSFICECGKVYAHHTSLWNHRTYNCGKQPQFSCPFCDHVTFRKGNLKIHVGVKHPGENWSIDELKN